MHIEAGRSLLGSNEETIPVGCTKYCTRFAMMRKANDRRQVNSPARQGCQESVFPAHLHLAWAGGLWSKQKNIEIARRSPPPPAGLPRQTPPDQLLCLFNLGRSPRSMDQFCWDISGAQSWSWATTSVIHMPPRVPHMVDRWLLALHMGRLETLDTVKFHKSTRKQTIHAAMSAGFQG